MRNNVTDLPDDVLFLDNQFCFTLYAASRKVIQLYGPMLKQLDLTYTQYITMLVLWQYLSLPMKDLGQHLMLDTGTLTPLLKKMERKGLLSRVRSKTDERVVVIELTEKGSALRLDALQMLPLLLCSAQLNSSYLIEIRDQMKEILAQLKTCNAPSPSLPIINELNIF
jgi:MarR family transcriptional regulator, organic hydroperoxide resistance regulator